MNILQSPLLSQYKNLLHAFSTKKGGLSKTPFSGNNLAFHVNDNPHTVRKNHQNFAKDLGYPYKRLIRMEQIHGDSVVIIDQDSDLQQIPRCDAVITKLKNTPLMVMVADCLPILLYDPVKEVIATVHAGRAGVFSKIITKTIQTMLEAYKSQASDLRIVIGPSIHQCCYEVGSEINEEAKSHGYGYAIKTKNNRYFLGLKDIVLQELKELNVVNEHIEFSPYCTSCRKDIFYSYRAEDNLCGRFCGLVMLR